MEDRSTPAYPALAAPDDSSYIIPLDQSGALVVGDQQAATLGWHGQPLGKLWFLPGRGAFRAGSVSRGAWNGANVGAYSWAGGCNTVASGEGSLAMGFAGVASGHYTVALGTENDVSGDLAAAVGGFNKASGAGSFAAGVNNTAAGDFASAFGCGTTAASYAEFVVGSYNTAPPDATAGRPRPTDRAFVVGTGTAPDQPHDGFVVYKDGSLSLTASAQVPADPTNRVYVLEGKLHFNGKALATAVEEQPDTLQWRFASQRNTITLPTAPRRGADVELPLTAAGGFVNARLALYNQAQALRFGSFNEADQSRSMGHNSVGLGNYATASGEASLAVGYEPQASGAHATALGFKAVAQGQHAFAVGASADQEPVSSRAYGNSSVALSGGRADGEYAVAWARGNATGEHAVAAGYGSRAAGDFSVALGRFATAPSYGEVAVGISNTDYQPANSRGIAENDRAFCVGVGDRSQKDALVVFKNGRMLLNNTEPATGKYSAVKGLLPAQLQINAEQDGVTILNNPLSNSLNIVKRFSYPTIDTRFISFGYRGEKDENYVEVGSIRANGNNSVRFYESSDARLKNDAGPLTNSLATLARIQIHQFTWKDTGAADTGVFAQELYQVLPAAVRKGDDEAQVQERWMVDYAKLNPVIVAAVQELHQLVLRQQEQITQLQQQVATLLQNR